MCIASVWYCYCAGAVLERHSYGIGMAFGRSAVSVWYWRGIRTVSIYSFGVATGMVSRAIV